MFKTKYRIIKDNYLGYEAQYKKWWMPFWKMVPVMPLPVIGIFWGGGLNTALSERQAQQFIEWDKNGRTTAIF